MFNAHAGQRPTPPELCSRLFRPSLLLHQSTAAHRFLEHLDQARPAEKPAARNALSGNYAEEFPSRLLVFALIVEIGAEVKFGLGTGNLDWHLGPGTILVEERVYWS